MNEFQLLGTRIRQLRKKGGLTQEELADRCGIHYKFLGGIERGKENPTLAILSKIARSLHVPLAGLFEYELLAQDSRKIRKGLIDGIQQCGEREVLLLYRLLRWL